MCIRDRGFTWYLAFFAILIGHVLALRCSHLIFIRITHQRKDVLILSIAHIILMVLLTMMSLIIIAEPMTIS